MALWVAHGWSIVAVDGPVWCAQVEDNILSPNNARWRFLEHGNCFNHLIIDAFAFF